MEKLILTLTLMAFVAGLTLQKPAEAQYAVSKSVLGNGGAVISNNSYRMVGTLGQDVIGVSSSSSHIHLIGFWYTTTSTPLQAVSIKPDAPSTARCGKEFWVAVDVGDPDPVTVLFGVSFDLTYQTTYIDYVSAQSTNPVIGPGNFLGGDLIFIATPDDASGKVSVGVSRKSGQGGVSGSGAVVWIKFVSQVNTPDPTDINWSLSNISANDPIGNAINLTPVAAKTTIRCGCFVWPGDTNNDGVVNAADVLPVGLHFGKTGPTRSGASLSWSGQIVTC
ncbi:MAG: hypothetical protein ACE5HS_18130, partial [bacterium]